MFWYAELAVSRFVDRVKAGASFHAIRELYPSTASGTVRTGVGGGVRRTVRNIWVRVRHFVRPSA